MSLFGGDRANATESSSEADSIESRTFAHPSSRIAEPASPQSAQDARHFTRLVESDTDDDLYTESEADVDDFDDEQPTRANRFAGQPQTWKGYTAADRQIAASIDQIQDSDLAAHLYNAHALKRRVRRPLGGVVGLRNWQSRDNWLKKGKDLQYTDVSGMEETELVPSKDWTAWPLPPVKLPSTSEQERGDVTTYGWSISGANAQDAGQELRDETLAVFLRLAKEAWNSRESDDKPYCDEDRTSNSRARSRSKNVRSVTSHQSTSRPDMGMKSADDYEVDATDGEDKNQDEDRFGKKRGRKVQTESIMAPTLSADDAKTQRLLQPSIQSMMDKIDELALAVYRTRLNHFGRGASADISSHSEATSGAESTEPESIASSRAVSRLKEHRKSQTKQSSSTASPCTEYPVNSGTRTEDKLHQVASDGDSDYSNASIRHISSHAAARKRVRSESTASGDSNSTTRDQVGRAGLIDWSEVLGLAAVTGWDERVLARTAQRCADLFGETVSFLPFDESLATKPLAEPVLYMPDAIPALEHPTFAGLTMSKRPFFQVGTLRCPHTDCYAHDKDLALPYRVVEHCMRVHDYDPRTNDSDNEERTVGGVQIDGFLQPVTVKPGWLGHGRAKAGKASKKLKVEQDECGEVADALESIED